MSLFGSILKIFAEHPVVKTGINDFLTGLLQSPQKKSNDQEIAEYNELLEKAKDDGFEAQFSGKFDYYAVLLALCVKSTVISGFGKFVQKFYNNNFILYFPPIDDDPEFKKVKNEKFKEDSWIFIEEDNNRKYQFYLINSDLPIKDLDDLKNHLVTSASEGKIQKAEFTAKMKIIGEDKYYICYGISTIQDGEGTYKFEIAPSYFSDPSGLEKFNLGNFAKQPSLSIKKKVLDDIKI